MTTQLTNRQLMALFNVSQMTTYLWRTKTTANRPKPIPTIKPKKGEPANQIRYDADKVVTWAEKLGYKPVISVAKAIKDHPVKTPGPRAGTKVSAA